MVVRLQRAVCAGSDTIDWLEWRTGFLTSSVWKKPTYHGVVDGEQGGYKILNVGQAPSSSIRAWDNDENYGRLLNCNIILGRYTTAQG